MARTDDIGHAGDMTKPILRAILTQAAVVFAHNLLMFSHGRHIALPL